VNKAPIHIAKIQNERKNIILGNSTKAITNIANHTNNPL
jgi:hypothetical protein